MKADIFKAGIFLLLTAAVLCLTPPIAQAESAEKGRWEFFFSPYLWAVGLDADVTVNGLGSTVDMDFGDILDKMDMGFIGYLEARLRPWSFYVDYTYLDVSDSAYTAISKIDYNSQSSTLEVGLAYEAVSQELGQGGPVLALDGLLAGRALIMESEVKFPRLGNQSDDKSWVDPLIGVRMRLRWPQGFFLNARADIGGFGLSSKLTYKLEALAGYQFHPNLAAFVGFRDLYYDYKDGEGRDEFAFKGHMYGPLLGIIFSF